MTKKNIISVLALFIILFIAVGAASAATDSEIIANDVSDNNGLTDVVSNDNPVNGTFSDLNSTISGKTYVELDRDYVYDSSSDSAFEKGIIISNNLVINGKNHIIDGKGLAAIFNFSGSELTINNLTIENGVRAIQFDTASTLRCDNVYFENNKVLAIYGSKSLNISANNLYFIYSDDSSNDSGSITTMNNFYLSGNNIHFITAHSYVKAGDSGTKQGSGIWSLTGSIVIDVNNTSFINCLSNVGGAISSMYGSFNITGENITFKNCSATRYGGAIYGGNDIYIQGKNILFENSSAQNGGAIVASSGIVNLSGNNFSFVNCSASVYSVIFAGGSKTSIDFNGISFINCSSNSVAVILSGGFGSVYIANCIFDNCNSNTNLVYFNSEYNVDGNYWGRNYNTSQDFIDSNVIIKDDVPVAPNNWVLMNITGPETITAMESNNFTVSFVNSTGDSCEALPDYTVVIGDKNVDITNNNGEFTYTPSSAGEFTLTATSLESGVELTSNTFTAIDTSKGFTQLQADINAADNVLNLAHNYYYIDGYDTLYTNGVVIDKDLTINGNGNTISGLNLARILNVNASCTVTINNVTFDNGNANGGNGGAINNLGNLNINDCIFLENYMNYALTTEIYGGAIYSAPDSTLTINNSVFRRNCVGSEFTNTNSKLEARSINGGAISAVGATVLIDNTLFDENTARWGSALLTNGGNIQVMNCNITNSNVYNGAFNINGNVNVTNCKFSNNDAKYVGSVGFVASGADIVILAFTPYSANVIIDDCTFDHSKVTSPVAGAGSIHAQIYNNNPVEIKLTIKNSNFTNVMSTERAAVYNYNATLTIDNVAFENCSAKIGGAIYNKLGTATVTNSNFTNCSAKQGGAIYNNDTLTVTGSKFIGNRALFPDYDQPAGAAICSFGDLSVDDCLFDGNKVNWTTNHNGGAIYQINGDCNITNSNFTNNGPNPELFNNNEEVGCTCGGAVYIKGPNTLIDNCIFDHNTGRWGIVYLEGEKAVVNNTLINNNYLYQGALDIETAKATVVNTNITNNVAELHGSTGYKALGSSVIIVGDAEFDNCQFVNNRDKGDSNSNGKSFYVYSTNSNVVVKNSLFKDISTVKAPIANNGKLTIENTEFININTTNDGIIYTTDGSVLNISNSEFKNNIAKQTSLIKAEDANVIIDNVNFTQNTVKNGVVIDSINGKLNVTNSNFINNLNYTVESNYYSNDENSQNGVITSAGTSYLADNKFNDNENDIILANLECASATIGNGNTADEDSYISNAGSLTGASTVLNEEYVSTQINETTKQSVNSINFTAKVLTDSGDILVKEENVDQTTLTLSNEQECILTKQEDGTYAGTLEQFDATPGVQLYTDSIQIGGNAPANGKVLPTAAPDGSLAQLKEMIDANGTVPLSRSFAYNASSDSGIRTIEINKPVTITGNENTISANGSDWTSLFTVVEGGSLTLNNVVFGSEIPVVNVSSGELTVADCISVGNTEAVKYVSGTINNMTATVLGNTTIVSSVGSDVDLYATVEVGGLNVYNPSFTLTDNGVDVDTEYENGQYIGSITLDNNGNHIISISSIENVSTGTIIALDSSCISVSNAEGTHGDTLNITICLEYPVEGYNVILYVGSDANNISFDDFVKGEDDKYYYNYSLNTANIKEDRLPLYATVVDSDDNVLVSSPKTARLLLTGKNPVIDAISVSGNYSQIVNITVTITTGNKTGDRIVLHLIDGENVTAYVNESGVALFENITLTKAGNYVTEIVCSRPYGDEFYALATAPVTWDISKISTNVTFSQENITGKVNQTRSVVVTVKDFYNNTVKSGQINVTDSGIQLLYANGTAYDGTEFNLTEGSVTIYFKYLSADEYTPNFSYLNRNSTYSNNNNYIYSNADLNVNITKPIVNITVDECNVSGKVYDNITITGKVVDELGQIPDGNVTVEVNGVKFNATVNSTTGEFEIIVNSTKAGSWNNTPIQFLSNNETMWDNTNSTSPNLVNITVNQIGVNVTVNPDRYEYIATVNFTITGNVKGIDTGLIPTGNVTININGTYYNATVDGNGDFSIYVDGIDHYGLWEELYVEFESNNSDVWANNESVHNVTVQISPISVKIVLDQSRYDQYVNQYFNLTGHLEKGNYTSIPTGNVTIEFNSMNYTAPVNDDGTFVIENLFSDKYIAFNSYDMRYISNNTKYKNYTEYNAANITVNLLPTNITVISIDEDKKVNQNVTIQAYINDTILGQPVNGTAYITINGTKYNATAKDGYFNFTFSSPIGLDEYDNITFVVSNSSVWENPANKSVHINVSKLDTSITVISVTPDTVVVYENVTVTGYVNDTTYNKGAPGNITISVNGQTFNTTTDENGYFELNVSSNVKHELANYTISFVTTNSSVYNNPENANANFTVNPLNTTVTVDPVEYNGTVCSNVTITGTVKDNKWDKGVNGTVFIELADGVEFNATVDPSTGAFSIIVNHNVSGNYTNLKVRYVTNNTDVWDNSNSTANINISLKQSTINITVDDGSRISTGVVYENITISGKIVDGNKQVPKGTISIEVNGKTFYGIINETTGAWSITYNSTTAWNGTDIPIVFKSNNTSIWNDTNSSSPNVVKIKISPSEPVVKVNPLVYVSNATQEFNITGNVTVHEYQPIPVGNVTICINGTYYNATVDGDGKFSIPVTINNAGHWTSKVDGINVTFISNDSTVWNNATSDPNDYNINVTINKLNTTVFVTNGPDYSANVNGTITITGNVTDSLGKAAQGKVKLTLNGVEFNATLNEDGTYSLDVNSTQKVAKGNYTVQYISNNTGIWNDANSTNITIEVLALNTTIHFDVENRTFDYRVNETFYITGNVTDDVYHNGVAGVNVTAKIGGFTYWAVTDANGKFNITVKANQTNKNDGTFENVTVNATNPDANVWNKAPDENISVRINALKVTLVLTSDADQTKYVGQNATYTGYVIDEYNNTLNGIDVVYKYVGGSDNTVKTDATGNFTINLTSAVAQDKIIYTISLSGVDSKVYNTTGAVANISSKFLILPTVVTVDNVTYTGKVNSTITITGTVKDDSIYNAAANGTVYLTLNGKEFSAPVDPTTGAFTLNVSCNVSGTYKNLIIDYKTNNTGRWDNSSSEKITIKIQALTVYIISNYDLEGKNAYNGTFNRLRDYTFNVTDENGNAVLNGTLNLNLDNETLSANVTNGQATFKNVLFNDTGLFDFIVDYVGNKFYKSVFNFTDINVAKVATTVYINSSISDDNKVLNITVKDDIDNKTVIKGTIYYVTPDGQGHEINLTDGSAIVDVVANRTGEYDIAVSYYDLEEDYLYSEQDFKYNITVAGIETQFQGVTDPTNGELSGNKLLITSTVRSDEGNIIENGEIEYLIGGTKYTAGLVNGVASLEVDFTGPIMVIAKFTGEDCTQAKEVYVVEPSFDNINDELATILG